MKTQRDPFEREIDGKRNYQRQQLHAGGAGEPSLPLAVLPNRRSGFSTGRPLLSALARAVCAGLLMKTKGTVMRGFKWDDLPDVMNIGEVSDLLEVSTRTAREMFQRGDIKAVKCGAKWLCAKENIRAYVKGD